MKSVFQRKDDAAIASIKDVDGKQGIVTGYFSNFNTVDSDRDIIRPGSFTKTVNENGPASAQPRIRYLLNHDSTQPLGKLLELKEDTEGLYYEAQVGSHTLGQDFLKMIESDLIHEHSIGYQVIKQNQVGDWDKGTGAVYEIIEVKLWEGSALTGWGANMYTPLTGMKSAEKSAKAAKRCELLMKAIRNGTFTDETFELLEIELKQLQQLFIDLTEKTTEPGNPTQPAEEKSNTEPINLNSLFTLKKAQ